MEPAKNNSIEQSKEHGNDNRPLRIDLCKIFDVEEGQKFSVDSTHYKIVNNELLVGITEDLWLLEGDSLNELVNKVNCSGIVKTWKPKEGEIVYLADPLREKMYLSTTYYDTWLNKMQEERNMLFRTKEEAIACAKKMLNSIKVNKEN